MIEPEDIEMALLVLVHGLIGSLNATFITQPFNRPVRTPDLLGYGAQGSVRHDWTIADQVDHLATWLRRETDHPVDLVGHSVGGAVAMVLAASAPSLVRSLTTVEGNFTLGDAFWSAQIARQPLGEVELAIDEFRADPAGWLRNSGFEPCAAQVAIARTWLDYQSAATIQQQARAVVAATGAAAYLDAVRQVLASGINLHLLGGARSRADWCVPDWVREAAASDETVPGAGHLMMLERPEIFAKRVEANLH